METERAEFSISELAQEFDVTPRAIRFYEAEGLLAPRREGQRRIYTPRDRTRLKLTLRAPPRPQAARAGKRPRPPARGDPRADRHVRAGPRRPRAARAFPGSARYAS